MPLLLAFLFLSFQNFASSGVDILSFDESISQITSEATTSVIIDVIEDAEKQLENMNSGSEELPQCWIMPISCSCGTFETQWCDDGYHPPLIEWYNYICCAGCGDDCLGPGK